LFVDLVAKRWTVSALGMASSTPEQACVFCAVIAGRREASRVYEEDASLVFADLWQPTAAHLLVVPKQHVETIYDLAPDLAAQLMQTVVRTAQALRRAVRPPGLMIWQANGAAAQQEVPHLHVHLLVRQPGDGLFQVDPAQRSHPDRAALDRLAATVRAGFR
jgi:histidine triad (HIT) family protein